MSGMFKKRRFKRRSPISDEMSLQITSMADVFTILLVFLLKSYTTGSMNLSPSKGVLLPEAQAAESQVEALKVEIAVDAVSIEGAVAAPLQKFVPAQTSPNGTIPTLAQAFGRERKRQVLISKSNSDVKLDPKMIVVADSRAPYSIIKAVLASGAIHGYTDFKLAVIKGE
jgi:biopolymer transport protein ExbD